MFIPNVETKSIPNFVCFFLSQMGIKSNMFCSAPQNTVDYEHFAASVTIFDKKPQADDDPAYVTVPSKVGTIIACK